MNIRHIKIKLPRKIIPRFFLLLAGIFLFTQIGTAQQKKNVTGKVIDAGTSKTLPGVNIVVQGTQNGTSTNSKGQYELTIESLQDTLVFSFVGYQKQVVPINGRMNIDIALKTKLSSLKGVVVTGFGEISKRQTTGSSSEISSKDIKNQPVASPAEALKGKVTGVRVTSSTGTPGSVQQINIRGISSINASTNPLYVIDGVPVISGEVNAGNTGTSLSVLSSISPSDIKSMTVLKSAVATSLYGARGSNGVIVIKTKGGSKGRATSYNVSYQRGWNKAAVDGPEMVNSQQWAELYREGAINVGTDPSNVNVPWDGVTNTDWKKVLAKDHSLNQKFNISAQGGTESTTYFASATYRDQSGLNLGSKFKQMGANLNVGYDLNENINLSNKLTASYVKQNGVEQGSGQFASPLHAKYFLIPTLGPYNKDGSLNINNFNTRQSIYNPIWIAQNDINQKQTYRLIDNATLNIDLLKNLTFVSQLGIDFIDTEGKYYDNPIHGNGKNVNGQINANYSRNFNYTWKNSFDYKLQINQDNELDIKVLQEVEQNKNYTVQAEAQNFATTGLTNAASAGKPTNAYSYDYDYTDLAFLGNIRYSFKDKVNLTANYRYEGNSHFAKENRWGGFYSFGASWLLTEEPFLETTEDWLDNFKVRATYGKTGNAGIGVNEYQTFLGYNNAYNGNGAITSDQLGNKSLTWEKATSIDAGIDVGLFNRISISATYFRKNSKDLLLNVPISSTSGQSFQRRNIGKLYNRGVELSLNVEVIKSNYVNWDVGVKYTKVEAKVTKLPTNSIGNPTTLTTQYKYTGKVGLEPGAWYLKSWAGVNSQNGKPLWYVNKTDGQGNVIGRTTTSDYNKATKYYQGASAMPKDYGNINTQLNIFGFYINATLSYTFGNKIYDYWYRYITSDGRHNYNYNATLQEYKSHWQKPGDKVRNPQIIRGGNNLSVEPSSRFLYKGDYLRLEDMRVGYNVPASLLSHLNIGVPSATIYFVGRNLWTYAFDENLRNNIGWDPEVRQDGFIDFNTTPLKTFTFGINFKF